MIFQPGDLDRFDAALAAPRRHAALWRLGLGLMVTVFVYVVAMAGIFALLAIEARTDAALVRELADMMGGVFSARMMILFLFSFLPLILALWFVAGVLHERPFASLLGPDGLRPRDWLAGAALVAILSGTGFALSVATDAHVRNLAFADWWPMALLAVPALIVQTGAEELMFRGYLQQQLAARFRSPAVWLMLPALGFGMLHWNPETFGPNAPLVVAAAAFMGLILGDVTARTGNLSAALGLHFANNASALLLLALPGDMDPLALFVVNIDMADTAQVRASLLANLGLLVVAYLIWLGWNIRQGRRRPRRPA
jgi:membrane protease YdiL (CAAX protease family)